MYRPLGNIILFLRVINMFATLPYNLKFYYVGSKYKAIEMTA